MVEFFDEGVSRRVGWPDRPQAALLLAELGDGGRRFDAIVVGEYERAFTGQQLDHLAVARTPHGDVAVYVAHLPSVRLSPTAGFNTACRDDSARKLGAALRAEPLRQVILIGDLNITVDDRGLRPVSSQLNWAPGGFTLSWPAPMSVTGSSPIGWGMVAVAERRSRDKSHVAAVDLHSQAPHPIRGTHFRR